MHKEKLTNDSNRLLVFIFTIVGILFVISMYQFVKIERYGVIADILLIAVLSAGGVVLLKCFLTDYTYTIVSGDIIFGKSYGKQERGVMAVSFENIEAVFAVDSAEAEQYKNIKKVNRFVLNNLRLKKYCIVYRCKNTLEKVVFQPSEELLHMLEKALGNKVQ